MLPEYFDHTPEELCAGYAMEINPPRCRCLFCGKEFLQGEIFPMDGRLYDASMAVKQHVQTVHGGSLEALLSLEKKDTGLTDIQKELLRLFSIDVSDKEIARNTGVSPSTIRHQRFVFKEKARQARAFLAIYSCSLGSGRNNGTKSEPIPIHKGARMVDERYDVTKEEEEGILKNTFSSLDPLKLKVLSSKEKKKIVILRRITQLFSTQTRYSEQEVNEILKEIYPDYVTLRRYLIEYGFFERTRDGAAYWRKEE